MIVANTPQSHRDCPGGKEIPYYIKNFWTKKILSVRSKIYSSITNCNRGKVTLWDHHFQLTTNKLDAQQPSRFNVGGNQNLEIYDFPGGYARKYDGIDRGGGERPSDLQNVFPDKQKEGRNNDAVSRRAV